MHWNPNITTCESPLQFEESLLNKIPFDEKINIKSLGALLNWNLFSIFLVHLQEIWLKLVYMSLQWEAWRAEVLQLNHWVTSLQTLTVLKPDTGTIRNLWNSCMFKFKYYVQWSECCHYFLCLNCRWGASVVTHSPPTSEVACSNPDLKWESW